MKKKKEKEPKPPKAYQHAEEVAAIGRDLIYKYHEHLGPHRVDFVFVNEVLVSKGKEVWGKARVISGLNAYQSRSEYDGVPVPYFLIEISRPVWYRLKPEHRVALVDHELCHCWINETGKPTTMPHDVEEFSAVIQRHGLWKDDVLLFASVASRQPELFEMQKEAAAKENPGYETITLSTPSGKSVTMTPDEFEDLSEKIPTLPNFTNGKKSKRQREEAAS